MTQRFDESSGGSPPSNTWDRPSDGLPRILRDTKPIRASCASPWSIASWRYRAADPPDRRRV